MVWDIAAGMIIGGLAIGLIYMGVALQGEAYRHGDEGFAFGWIIALAGLGLSVWVLFFKAHVFG
jgi:hypothetical protein